METTAKPMGALLPGILDNEIGETVSSGPLTSASQVLDLANLPSRLDDGLLSLVREVANSPLSAPQSCDEQVYAKAMRIMALLPRKSDGDDTGRLRDNLYRAKLGSFSNEALMFLASKASEQCHWFPSIAECLKILATWPNRDVAEGRQVKAEVLVRNEMQARMNEAIERLQRRELDQAQIDALPRRWKLTAAEKCLLWAWPDGRFTVRRDFDLLDEGQANAEREVLTAMFSEWDAIRVAQAAEELPQ